MIGSYAIGQTYIGQAYAESGAPVRTRTRGRIVAVTLTRGRIVVAVEAQE